MLGFYYDREWAQVMTVNVHEAKTHFSKLLQRVAAGEDIVIAKAGKPVARLTALKPKRAPRRLGLAKGKVFVPDDFDAPMPDFEAEFYGEATPRHARVPVGNRRSGPPFTKFAKRD